MIINKTHKMKDSSTNVSKLKGSLITRKQSCQNEFKIMTKSAT